MVLFYTNIINENQAIFQGDEMRHMISSLRKQEGEHIHFIDGKGHVYEGVITKQGKRSVEVDILHKTMENKPDPYLHIAISPTKSIDRLEWFLEKSIEIGVNEISLIKCKHSERKQVKMDRLERIAIAACKQSKKASLPQINELITYEELIEQYKNAKQKFIATLIDGTKSLSSSITSGQEALICIGPEGGFRESEVQQAISTNFQAVSLGDYRLRTETAGLYSVANFRIINDMR